MPQELEATVHAVVVSYRSADTLRGCVEPLTAMPGVAVTVVDNASPDDSVATIADLDVDIVRSPRNGGFSYGCNLGAARASAPFLLFLNPDARIEPAALEALLDALRADPGVGLVGPRLLEPGDELAFSVRRFPSNGTTFAQALFLHRLWPQARWSDELVRDAAAYDHDHDVEWLSGACMVIRRDLYESIGGFDERFFLYSEDTDLCRRVWDAGRRVRFVSGAVVRHVGGASSGAGETQPILARSRVLYARKHDRPLAARVHAAGVALGEATHAVTAIKRPRSRRGHMAALRALLTTR
jgi:N-acetylglucosaminyl-diphospho-decaprenol L-rhamnosyltransferase